MDSEKEKYQQRVYAFMESIQPGPWVDTKEVCRPENYDQFIEVVKKFIDQKSCCHELSTDYRRIRRLHPFTPGHIRHSWE